MKITYIYHSSYLIEFENLYMLFDYFNGELPKLNKNKPIYVFSSHSHADHFDISIFDILKDMNTKYILSRDIYKKHKIEADNITYVYPNKEYEIDNINIKTLKSTDLGVAFLMEYNNKTIFHSGDLHYWVWREETKEYNNNMEINYKREIEKLKNINIDIAFVPLDPRQEDWYYMGMNYIIDNLKVKNVFPMHLWDKYEIIDKFISEGYNKSDVKIFRITKPLDNWEV
ncbi:MAG: MBL fold metallo-hydrolase [Lachnospirales bacterium]